MTRLNVDQINIALMLLSVGIAYLIPFELVLISYAFLGPAHYLTEISWLHDRTYFTGAKWAWIPFLILTALVLCVGKWYQNDAAATYIVLVAALSFSAGMALAKNWKTRVSIMAIASLIFILASKMFPPFEVAFAILLPTVIHIYIFTGLFILSGALKTGGRWGMLSFMIFLLCGVTFIFVSPSMYMISNDFVDANLGFFDNLVDYITSVASFDGRINGHAVLAFLSFAYTYHYLNWFSKTEVIKWHLIPRRRLTAIVVLYLLSVSIYLIDFKIGFLVLAFMSLAHVVMELPLNVLSIKLIGASFKQRF